MDQRKSLFLEAHGGRFGAHLSDVKVYSELRRHYWWVGMWRDITQWTRGWHGVPSEVLSDRGRAFLSGLLREVQQLLVFKKANMSAYHPQTDGLVQRFNTTLTTMLAKTVEKRGPDWDKTPLRPIRLSSMSAVIDSGVALLFALW